MACIIFVNQHVTRTEYHIFQTYLKVTISLRRCLLLQGYYLDFHCNVKTTTLYFKYEVKIFLTKLLTSFDYLAGF